MNRWVLPTALGLLGILLWPRSSHSHSRTRGTGTLVFEGGYYQLTHDDLTWLAKSLKNESAEREGRIAAAWCMLQRFVARRQAGRVETFSSFIRAFSQPINPIWADHNACRDGKGCCGSTSGACSPDKVARRQELISTSWDELCPCVTDLVLELMTGSIPNPVEGFTDFAASSSRACRQNETCVVVGGNRFIYGSPPLTGKVEIK